MKLPLLKKTYHAIGLMSGSSLDGLDVVYASFTYNKKWSFCIEKCKTVSLGIWEEKLRNAPQLTSTHLENLSKEFGVFLAEQSKLFIHENEIQNIDIVVSHGHTIYHYPEQKKTCQIGDGKQMFDILKLPVLTNLRQADINAGGQGAPIVPIGDLHLFDDFKFCLNIGGITNLSVKQSDKIIAYDIAMANQILNFYSQKLGKPYDDKGEIAASGKVNSAILYELNGLDFYINQAPKSLDNAYRNTVLALIETYNETPESNLATYTLHLAKQIAKEINLFVKNSGEHVLVSGGGAYNKHLIYLIKQELECKVFVPHSTIVNYKEALVMAFMGVLYLRQENNVLSSVTGALKDTICGKLYL